MENTELKNRFVVEENVDEETERNFKLFSDNIKKYIEDKLKDCSEDSDEDKCEIYEKDITESQSESQSERNYESQTERNHESQTENDEEKNDEDSNLVKNCDFFKKIFYNLYFKCTDIQFWYQNNREKVLEYASSIIFGGILFTVVTLFIKMYLNLICY